MTKQTIINHKKYAVEYVFNMVGNWWFTDKNGAVHLVDGQDVQEWAQEQELKWNGINTAIAFAKYYANESENGVFWWKVNHER